MNRKNFFTKKNISLFIGLFFMVWILPFEVAQAARKEKAINKDIEKTQKALNEKEGELSALKRKVRNTGELHTSARNAPAQCHDRCKSACSGVLDEDELDHPSACINVFMAKSRGSRGLISENLDRNLRDKPACLSAVFSCPALDFINDEETLNEEIVSLEEKLEKLNDELEDVAAVKDDKQIEKMAQIQAISQYCPQCATALAMQRDPTGWDYALGATNTILGAALGGYGIYQSGKMYNKYLDGYAGYLNEFCIPSGFPCHGPSMGGIGMGGGMGGGFGGGGFGIPGMGMGGISGGFNAGIGGGFGMPGMGMGGGFGGGFNPMLGGGGFGGGGFGGPFGGAMAIPGGGFGGGFNAGIGGGFGMPGMGMGGGFGGGGFGGMPGFGGGGFGMPGGGFGGGFNGGIGGGFGMPGMGMGGGFGGGGFGMPGMGMGGGGFGMPGMGMGGGFGGGAAGMAYQNQLMQASMQQQALQAQQAMQAQQSIFRAQQAMFEAQQRYNGTMMEAYQIGSGASYYNPGFQMGFR